jgi:DNA-binding beta-propeller fold protein YncE
VLVTQFTRAVGKISLASPHVKSPTSRGAHAPPYDSGSYRTNSISFGTAAYGLGLTPGGNQLYVLLAQAGEVRVLDRPSRAPVKTLVVGGTPRNVAFASDGTALVTNEQAAVFIQ